jgi:hypothetical protein
MSLILFYGLIFVAGPLIVLALMRRPATVAAVRNLGMATAAAVVLAIAAGLIGVGAPFLATFLLWLGWVLSMALMGQVLRLMLDRPAAKWPAVVAALGATLPWFGLALAQGMAG